MWIIVERLARWFLDAKAAVAAILFVYVATTFDWNAATALMLGILAMYLAIHAWVVTW